MNKVLVKQTYLCRRQIYSILQRNYLFSNNVINLSTSSSCVLDKRKTVSPKTRCGIDIGRYGWLPCQHLVANIHTTTNSMAGHNRWSNIKHIKGRSDDKRATLWAYHLRTIKGVLQQKKELDPKFNPELAKCLDAAKRAGVPTDVLNRAMVKLRRADLKPYLLLAENAEGVGVLLHCMITEEHELKLLHSPLRKKGYIVGRKANLAYKFDHKGVITAPPEEGEIDLDKYVEIGLEAGAEDVTLESDQEGKSFIQFISQPGELKMVTNKIEKMGLNGIQSQEVYSPIHPLMVSQETADKVNSFFEQMMSKHECIEDVTFNFEIMDEDK